MPIIHPFLRRYGFILALGVFTILEILNLPRGFEHFGLLAFLIGGFGVLVGRMLVRTAPLETERVANGLLDTPVVLEPTAPPALPELSKQDVTREVQNVIERLPFALIHLDASGHIKQCNLAAREMLMLGPQETVGFDDLVEGLGRSVNSWLNSVRTTDGPSKAEMVRVKRRGADAVLQVSLMHPPVLGSGELFGTLNDVTEIKSMEAQFVQTQKMQAIGQLAGGVAHDFNNLLTAISGYCDLLLLRHEKGDPDNNDLIQINQNANRAAALVGQLLAFSRKQTLQPQVVQVNDTLSDLTHLLSRLLGEKVQLAAEYGRDLPDVYVDARQLEQVIMNLVVNARDAMQDGGEVTVSSAARQFESAQKRDQVIIPAGTYVSIKVSDTGTGISKEDLTKIFEPFFSTKDVGEGTGLGLSMAYGIIKQTGGFIFADSTLAVGTVFEILLPAAEPMEKVEEAPKAQKKMPKTALNGLSVMLVEDEAPVRTFASRALGMHGVFVTEASSAETAIEVLANKELHIDIIVSDVVMPGMDGPTWVRKALEDRPDIQVIFVSGYAEEAFSKDHSRIPNSVFMPKPFSLKELIEKVRELAE